MKIIPVIHHLTSQLTLDNAQICAEENAFGLFLISMRQDNEDLPMIAKAIKGKYQSLKVGINLLGQSAIDAIEISLDFGLDMTWSDNPIVVSSEIQVEAKEITSLLKDREHMFFNSVAFKYQAHEKDPGLAAINSRSLGFIPTTSGNGTGEAADVGKIQLMKESLGDYPLAVASGLTTKNVGDYMPYIEYGLVATGISKSFYEMDREKMKLIIELAQK